jgi:hypothetical protein
MSPENTKETVLPLAAVSQICNQSVYSGLFVTFNKPKKKTGDVTLFMTRPECQQKAAKLIKNVFSL